MYSIRNRNQMLQHVLFVFFFMLCVNIPYGMMGQKISFQAKNVTVREAVMKLQRESGLSVTIVNSRDFDLNKVISVKAEDADLKDVLAQIFKGQSFTLDIKNKHISILKSNTKSAPKSFRLSGVVRDKKSSEPLIGVSISTSDNEGTITDYDGKFSLNVKSGDYLNLSYVGYESKKVTVPSDGPITILLSEKTELLNEVVVVGYGTQKKVNMTGAVSVIHADEINGRPVSNAAMALQGVDPGMNISINSGTPGSGYNIDIRGVASLNGGTPLVLVDGVESSLSRVNANDIESVSVLKDASASAVYGAKASSGVVIVTTKSGSAGPAKVSYSGRYGIATNTVSTDFITTGYWSAKINDMFLKPYLGYGYTSYTDSDYEELYARINDKTEDPSRPWVIQQENGAYKYYANFDWYNFLYRKSRPMQEHNVSIVGGNDKLNYYVSGRYFSQDGMLKIRHDTYDTYSIRAKLSAKIKPWLKFSTNNSYYSSKRFFPGTTSVPNLIKKSYVHALAFVTPTNPDGSIVYLNQNANTTATVMDGFSAILINDKHRNTNYDKEYVTNNRVDVDVCKGLVLTGEYAYSFRDREYNNRSVNVPYSQMKGVTEWLTTGNFLNSYQEQLYRVENHNMNLFATYKNVFAKAHNVKLTAGAQYVSFQSKNIKVKKLDLLSDNLDAMDLATGNVTTLNGTISEYSTLGYFGRVNYDYLGRYLVEVSGRYDGSSRFKKDSRWGFFPSASVGWRMSEEPFWAPISDVVNNTKLRFSLGSLGNQQVSNYAYIDQISTNNVLKDYTIDGNTVLNYARESNPKSSSLTWEKVITYDWGLDMSFLKSRLTLTADAYIRDTKDMLLDGSALPAVYGANPPKMNGADMRTKGWEFYLGWNDKFELMSKPANYQLSFGIGDYVTKVTKYSNPTKLLTDHYEGETLGEIWGYTTDGLFASDEEASNYPVDQTFLNQRINASVGEPGLRAGDLKFKDLDDDNKISLGANTADHPGDRKIIGNTLPRYSYSFRMSAQWNGFDIAAFFQGIGRQHWYPGTTSMSFWGPYCRPYASFIPSRFLDDVWSETNTNAYFPRPRGYEALNANYSLGSANDRYIQNIAYLRLKNLTVGYTIPVLKKVFDEFRIYFSGENLFYFSPLKKHSKYIDPEQAKSGDVQDDNSGLSYNFSKVFSFGVNLSF